MPKNILLAATIIAVLLQMSWDVRAFECPSHIAEVEAIIDKASEGAKQMRGGMSMAVQSHLRHARMSLAEAEHHHSEAGNYHHARSIVRANEARGHAVVANLLALKTATQ